MTTQIKGLFAALALVVALPSIAAGQAVDDFYVKNNRIRFYIAEGPGSGADAWSRIVGKYMSNHLPGNPIFLITEMPGAGSLILANNLYNQAPKDGTAIGMISPSLPAQVLVGLENANFDPLKAGWLGSPEQSDHACVVTKVTGVKTIAEVRAKEVLMGGNGPTTTNDVMPPILNKLVGTKFKVITGYKSVPETFLAMDRGEINGMCARLDTMTRTQPDKFKNGDYVVLFNLNEKPIPGMPSAFEFITSEDDKRTMRFLRSSTALGRPMLTPPGLPPARLAQLRKAFDDTMKDPAFLAEAEKQKLVVTATNGPDLAAQIETLFKTPKDIAEKAKALVPTP